MTRPEPKRDRYGRYILPDPETGKDRAWTRATTLAKAISDETALTRWKLRTALRGAVRRPALLDQVATTEPDDKATLDAITEKALEAGGAGDGAKHGTQVHAWTEHVDLGGSLTDVPGEFRLDVRAYVATLNDAGVMVLPEYVERMVVNTKVDVVGTLDRLVHLPDGRLVVADVKTAKNVHYGWLDIAAQLAIYATADYLWNWEAEAWEPMPADLDMNWGLIMHVPAGAGECSLWTVDLAAGWEAAQLAARVRQARGKRGLADPVDLAAWRLFGQIRTARSVDALRDLWCVSPQWTDVHTEAARLRRAELETIVV